jgi:outer membrane protein TolC
LVEAWKQIQVAKKSIEQAQENLRINQVCYKAGTLTLSDLLQAQLLLQNTDDQYTDAYVQYQIASVNYRITVGL